MTRHQIIEALVPGATVLAGLFGGWCGYKRRWVTLFIGLTSWFIFAVWFTR